MTERKALQDMLDRLASDVEAGLHANPDPDAFWPDFARQSSLVLDAAGPEHFDWVSSEVSAILAIHGISVPEA